MKRLQAKITHSVLIVILSTLHTPLSSRHSDVHIRNDILQISDIRRIPGELLRGKLVGSTCSRGQLSWPFASSRHHIHRSEQV